MKKTAIDQLYTFGYSHDDLLNLLTPKEYALTESYPDIETMIIDASRYIKCDEKEIEESVKDAEEIAIDLIKFWSSLKG